MKISNTLILGIGNTLLCDEGAGIHALNLLQTSHPDLPNLTFIDGGTLSFTLAAYIEDCDNLVVFDAAELKAPPGTVRTMAGADMDRFLGAARRSPHEVGLLDLFDIARLTGSLPVKRALIGIQPGSIEWGMSPSLAVANALPVAVGQAVELLGQWVRAERQSANNCSKETDGPINAGLITGVSQ
ncbi:MAG: HyaD/HybD family hydrogenase maturation endopeptidase [Lysobacterales bacterium]